MNEGDRIVVLTDAWDGKVGDWLNGRPGVVRTGGHWNGALFVLADLDKRRARENRAPGVWLPLAKVRPA